jgi:hypothetical protein
MRRACVLLLSVLLMLWSFGAAHAQTSGWSTPFEVSPPVPEDPLAGITLPTPLVPLPTATRAPVNSVRYGSSWFSDMAIGPDGSAHLVWYSGIAADVEGGSIDLLMYRELKNDRWSEINSIKAPSTGGYTVRNSIVLARDGRLHVIYRSKGGILYTSAPWQDAFYPQEWSPPQTITGGLGYYTALATDSRGALHAFWSEPVITAQGRETAECVDCADLFYRRSIDGGVTWSAPINLSRSPEGDNRPQVQIDGNDRIHVVWDLGVDWYAGKGVPKSGIYRRSDDGGETWSPPVTLGLPDQAVQQTALASDRRGNLLAVFRGVEDDRLYYQISSDAGRNWGIPLPITGVRTRDLNDNNLDRYTIAADSAGRMHLVFSGRIEGRRSDGYRLQLIHMVWDGVRWSPPETIMDNDLYPEWPTIVIHNGNQLHVTWFTRSEADLFNSDRARYRVWYSTRDIDTPATTPIPFFTPVPTITPPVVATATPAPTATPLPSFIADAPPPDGALRWEQSGLTIIVIALAPALAILGIVLLIRMRLTRRR